MKSDQGWRMYVEYFNLPHSLRNNKDTRKLILRQVTPINSRSEESLKRSSCEQKYEDLPQLPPSEPGYHPALQPYCHAQQGFRIKAGVTTWPVLSCPGPLPTFTTLKRILKLLLSFGVLFGVVF